MLISKDENMNADITLESTFKIDENLIEKIKESDNFTIIVNSKNSKILCGTFSVNQLYIFFKNSKIVITLDSLAAHVATCSETKVISLYPFFIAQFLKLS